MSTGELEDKKSMIFDLIEDLYSVSEKLLTIYRESEKLRKICCDMIIYENVMVGDARNLVKMEDVFLGILKLRESIRIIDSDEPLSIPIDISHQVTGD